ncbi:MAG: hypothetical protein QY304_03735 [Candidatus Paceibacterota bacterium]|nr:MAG: hypothetical protein QY304_03735 [Candidatus Paceibacterota bacterium]
MNYSIQQEAISIEEFGLDFTAETIAVKRQEANAKNRDPRKPHRNIKRTDIHFPTECNA